MRKSKLPVLLAAVIMTLLVVCSITPAYALVYSDGDVWIDTAGNEMTAEEAAQWTYTSATAGITLTKYSGTFTDGKINGNMPASINGKPVIKIDGLFKSKTSLVTAPEIPDTVTSMKELFYGCTKLEVAPEIPAGVTSLESVFYQCKALVNAPEIPEGVTDLTKTFYQCTSLVDAPEIPAGVTDMTSTFQGCTALVNAPVIPDTVTNMTNTFLSCTSLETAPVIPNSVTTGTGMFQGCTSLTGDVYIGDLVSPNAMFRNTSLPINVVYSQYSIYCAEYAEWTTTQVPANVTFTLEMTDDKGEIAEGWLNADGTPMYEKETKLWKLTVSNENYAVNYIGQVIDGEIVGQVPQMADGKTVVRFDTNGGKTGQEHSMFYGNAHAANAKIALTKAPVIPDTFTSLDYAFEDCTSLVDAPVIPASVTSLDYTFKGCTSLKTPPEIPSGVTSLNYTFAYSGIETAPVLPAHEELNYYNLYYTFYGCESLTEIPVIPESVTNLDYTFYNSTVLEGDIVIPDSVNNMINVFGGTTKPINMIYSADNTVAAEYAAESNVTKVVKSDYDESSVPTAGETDDSVEVTVKAATDIYKLEVGETLQLEATVSDDTLEYQWIVQDIFDTDPSAPYATIDKNGLVTATDGPGYVIAGLLVKFTDGTEHGYGMVLIEITKDNTIAAVPDDFRTGTTSSENPSGVRVPYGGSGSYNGGFNPSYSYQGTGYTSYDQLGGVSLIAGGGTGTGGGAGSGTGGSTGGTTGGTDGDDTDDGTVSAPSHTTTILDGTKYTEQSDITGEIVDKFVNYLRVGKGNQFEIVNLNPSDYDDYKLVSLSLTEQPSVVVTQDGYATAVYEGASIIVLADENDKVIDWHLVLVGDTDTYDGEMPDYTIEDMIYESKVNIGESNMPIYGKIEAIQMIDVTLPITMTFVIDAERLFHAEDAQILSNCPAPLDVTILSYNKSDNAPDLVAPDKYTDEEWNNLGKFATRNNLGLMLNGIDLSIQNEKLGHLFSAFEDEQTFDISLSAKYGKAWNNTEDISFTYNIVFEFMIP